MWPSNSCARTYDHTYQQEYSPCWNWRIRLLNIQMIICKCYLKQMHIRLNDYFQFCLNGKLALFLLTYEFLLNRWIHRFHGMNNGIDSIIWHTLIYKARMSLFLWATAEPKMYSKLAINRILHNNDNAKSVSKKSHSLCLSLSLNVAWKIEACSFLQIYKFHFSISKMWLKQSLKSFLKRENYSKN